MGKLIFILTFLCLFYTNAFAQKADRVIRPRAVEIRVFYPFVKFRDSAYGVSQKNYLGMGLLYEYFLLNNLGVFFEPGISGIPVRRNGEKAKLVNASLLAGAVIRPLPENWFNPQLFLIAGATAQDVGNFTPLDPSFPVGARGVVNLYSIGTPYQDNTLALILSGQWTHYISQISVIEPKVWDLGLGLRGSF